MKGSFVKVHSSQYDGYVLAPVDSDSVNMVSKLDGIFDLSMDHVMLLNRTAQQRKAIEVYCRNLARAMNDAGIDMHKLLEHREIPCSQTLIKEEVWKPAQKSMLDIDSTTKLSPAQVSEVYEVLNRFISSTFGVYVPFPCKENRDER